MQIDIQVRDWRFYLHKWKLKKFCREVIENAWAGDNRAEVSVVLADDDFVHALNKQYRKMDKPTNVLSFENDEEYEDEEGKWKCVGDIAISLDTLPVNSEYFEGDNNTELKRLLVHGLLHLNGMDHGEEHIEKGVAPVCEMLALQEKLLESLKDEKIIL